MTEPEPTSPERVLELLIMAVGNGDVVRLAALINTRTTPDQPFTRELLVDEWSVVWPHHLTRPGARPEQRVNRSLPNLIGAEIVSGVDGEQMTVVNLARLQFLYDRLYKANNQDARTPNNLTLTVGADARAEAALLVPGAVP